MTALQKLISQLDAGRQTATRSSTVFLRDVGHGLLEVSHNSLALFSRCSVLRGSRRSFHF